MIFREKQNESRRADHGKNSDDNADRGDGWG